MQGRVEWMSIRPERKQPVRPVNHVHASTEDGLQGDHPVKPHRQVTLISQEALSEVAARLGTDRVDPAGTRRNIVLSGLDFSQLEGASIRIGGAVVEITGICHPCELMNKNLGEGARAAMAGYSAGLTARVVQDGDIAIGDAVVVT
ncbi:MAG: MOSC domain-containing protein [Saprospiraceae bacterium]|nr:MOSC domain-containing protein [Saprospiraceae bacterium]